MARLSYAVVWREGDIPLHTGRLELGATSFVLEGSGPRGAVARRRIPYDDLREVRIGRAPEERINGRPSVILDRLLGPPITLGALDGPGAVFELGDVLAELASQKAARSSGVAVVAPIKRGARERVLELVRKGPPFDPARVPLERHRVFVTDREVVFLFEAPDAARAVGELARDPSVWKAAVAWGECLAGPPRLAEEEYSWIRDASSEEAARPNE